MNADELRIKVESLGPWYHAINLPHGVSTKGEPYEHVWSNIAKVRDRIDYTGKRVLDIASFDGKWAFEAEQKGALLVVATDCNWEPIKRFMFCREALSSKVIPFYNVPVQQLVCRLDVYFQGRSVAWNDTPIPQSPPTFDIVQHLGLLYHLVDPLTSLLQVRSVMHDGAILIIETGCWMGSEPAMYFNGVRTNRIYSDHTTWWAPTVPCLKEMLEASMFEVIDMELISGEKTGRVCLSAKAVNPSSLPANHATELTKTYRTPGYMPVS